MDWDIPDEYSDMNRTVLEPMAVSKFFSFAQQNGQTNITMRMEGITLEKNCRKTRLQKRTAPFTSSFEKIGLAYEKFSGEDFGFSQKKII